MNHIFAWLTLYVVRPLCILWFGKIRGWQIDPLPDVDKFILVAAPHTSNWDLVYLLYTALLSKRKIYWIGKESLFRVPLFRWALVQMGGIPVDRAAPLSAIKITVQKIESTPRIMVAIAPEGTRTHTDGWKRGFHMLARKANIPIVFTALDYEKKRGYIAPPMMPSRDIHADIAQIRPFYEGVVPRHPHKTGPIQIVD